MSDEQLYERINNLSIDLEKKITEHHTIKVEVEQIKVRLEEVIHSLHTAIERGNDLHLGIVLGQSLKELSDITYG